MGCLDRPSPSWWYFSPAPFQAGIGARDRSTSHVVFWAAPHARAVPAARASVEYAHTVKAPTIKRPATVPQNATSGPVSQMSGLASVAIATRIDRA